MSFPPSPPVLAPGARRLLAVTARAWGLRPAVRGPHAAPTPVAVARAPRAGRSAPSTAAATTPVRGLRFAISY